MATEVSCATFFGCAGSFMSSTITPSPWVALKSRSLGKSSVES
jgi:hypothetical protein